MTSCTARYHQMIDVTDVIEIHLIDPPKSPLRSYTEEVDGMVSSIKDRGLINPIIVRPVGSRFEVVAGAIRFEAVKRLRWARVPCIIRELRDKDAMEVALAENIQRKTMNALEEAEAFQQYVKYYGQGSETQLAGKIGKSQEYVSHRLSLLRLPETVKQEIMRRRISASMAQEIASIDDEKTQLALSKQIVEQGLTVKKLRELTRPLRTKISPLDTVTAPPTWTNGVESSDPDFAPRYTMNRGVKAVSKRKDLQKAIIIYKLAMSRMAALLDTLPEDSDIREMLKEHRMVMHNMADSLIHLKVKIEKSFGHE